MLKVVATAMSGLALALPGVAPASAEGVGSEDLPYTCAEYAQIETDPGDWACFDDILTKYSASGDVLSVSQMSPTVDVVPLAVVDPYTSNVTEDVVASLNGVGYRVPVSVKTRIYNHSPRLTMGYTSTKAVSLIWSVRIRRDNSFAADDTVFTYPDAYGSYSRVGLFTTTESQYGDGYNKLPYDGKKYFIDLFNLRLWDGQSTLNIVGSVQSDRMTCYKTVSCKFV